jgi:hypothetical protein
MNVLDAIRAKYALADLPVMKGEMTVKPSPFVAAEDGFLQHLNDFNDAWNPQDAGTDEEPPPATVAIPA